VLPRMAVVHLNQPWPPHCQPTNQPSTSPNPARPPNNNQTTNQAARHNPGAKQRTPPCSFALEPLFFCRVCTTHGAAAKVAASLLPHLSLKSVFVPASPNRCPFDAPLLPGPSLFHVPVPRLGGRRPATLLQSRLGVPPLTRTAVPNESVHPQKTYYTPVPLVFYSLLADALY
jgi:hypothetical protein